MTRGRLRRRLAVARARGNDRGASAVELAILAPALIFVSLLIVQFAIWFDARHAALAAAQQGDLVARENAATNPGGWQALAENAATSYYRGLDTSLISAVTAQSAAGPERHGLGHRARQDDRYLAADHQRDGDRPGRVLPHPGQPGGGMRLITPRPAALKLPP